MMSAHVIFNRLNELQVTGSEVFVTEFLNVYIEVDHNVKNAVFQQAGRRSILCQT